MTLAGRLQQEVLDATYPEYVRIYRREEQPTYE